MEIKLGNYYVSKAKEIVRALFIKEDRIFYQVIFSPVMSELQIKSMVGPASLEIKDFLSVTKLSSDKLEPLLILYGRKNI